MTIAVLGTESFGTAMANHLARTGQEVVLWCRTAEQARHINERRRNPRYLKEYPLVDSLKAAAAAEKNLAEALEGAGRVILALPIQSLRGVLERLAALPPEGRVFLSLAKGIEISTGLIYIRLRL